MILENRFEGQSVEDVEAQIIARTADGSLTKPIQIECLLFVQGELEREPSDERALALLRLARRIPTYVETVRRHLDSLDRAVLQRFLNGRVKPSDLAALLNVAHDPELD